MIEARAVISKELAEALASSDALMDRFRAELIARIAEKSEAEMQRMSDALIHGKPGGTKPRGILSYDK